MKAFQKKIWKYYRAHGRDLPWRHTKNPYHILVSEIMLQQTQVSRVLVKYKEFLRHFPTLHALSQSSITDVLKVWQGMGYNRRALALHRLARSTSTIPRKFDVLVDLPGIGPYTAGAIMVFAFNKPVAMIETNIRRVFIHEFLSPSDSPLSIRGRAEGVGDEQILKLVTATLDHKNPREWYYALMDYGAMLAKTVPNPNRRSKHYTKQSKFEGSHRQLRGEVLRLLLAKKPLPSGSKVKMIKKELHREGFVL